MTAQPVGAGTLTGELRSLLGRVASTLKQSRIGFSGSLDSVLRDVEAALANRAIPASPKGEANGGAEGVELFSTKDCPCPNGPADPLCCAKMRILATPQADSAVAPKAEPTVKVKVIGFGWVEIGLAARDESGVYVMMLDPQATQQSAAIPESDPPIQRPSAWSCAREAKGHGRCAAWCAAESTCVSSSSLATPLPAPPPADTISGTGWYRVQGIWQNGRTFDMRFNSAVERGDWIEAQEWAEFKCSEGK